MSASQASPAQAQGESFPDELHALLRGHREWLGGVLDLAAAEAQRAGLSLALILVLAGLLVIAAAGVWLFACAAVAVVAVQAGAPWLGALIGLALANLALVAVLALLIGRVSRGLGFAASRSVLRTRDAALPAAAGTS